MQIYLNANGNVYCIQPDGSFVTVSGSGGWGILRGLAFYKDRLFALYGNALTEMTATNYYYRSYEYASDKTLTELGDHLYTYEGSQLYKITFPPATPNKPIKRKFGRFAVTPRVVVGIPPITLFVSENNDQMFAVEVTDGDGEKLPGEGNPSAGVYYAGLIYAINNEGNIVTLDPNTGALKHQLTHCDRFEGSPGLALYKNKLYAIGKNKKFYEISPINGRVRRRGNTSYNYPGPMIGYTQ